MPFRFGGGDLVADALARHLALKLRERQQHVERPSSPLCKGTTTSAFRARNTEPRVRVHSSQLFSLRRDGASGEPLAIPACGGPSREGTEPETTPAPTPSAPQPQKSLRAILV